VYLIPLAVGIQMGLLDTTGTYHFRKHIRPEKMGMAGSAIVLAMGHACLTM